MWGATEDERQKGVYLIFQSTRPVRGATRVHGCGLVRSTFQSTRPVWGATLRLLLRLLRLLISIHAPRVGRDATFPIQWRFAAIFQSTRPVWGATAPG